MSIEPEIKRLHSPDVADLTTYVPEDPTDFGFLLQIIVGPVGREGEESFDVMVCTARWVGSHLGAERILMGRHFLFVDDYDYRRLEKFLREYVAQCSGTTWAEVADRIGRLGKWEFEDYRP